MRHRPHRHQNPHGNPQNPHGNPQNPHGHHQHNRNRRDRDNRDRNRQYRAEPPRRTPAEEAFIQKTPLTPFEWVKLETGSTEPAMRAMDLLTPVGKGQRGLIVSPPKAGKTTILKQICVAAHAADPKLKIYCMLVDERPEEVTDFRRSVPAEVLASSNDQPFQEHLRLSETVYQRAVGDAVAGNDVLIVLDSLTRLARAYNTAASGNKTLSGGLDSRAMEIPRRFFGAARKLEEGGSVTILATILVDTGSRMDEVIFQEFKGTGNMELVLSRSAAEARLFPAIHVKNSGTRREELLFPAPLLEGIYKLRRLLAGLSDLEATRTMIELLKKFGTNEKLVAAIQSGM